MRLIDADKFIEELKEGFYVYCQENKQDIIDAIQCQPTIDITEEQAIDKLHETGWLIKHDKEMTER